jgi:hypothetical protein
MIATSLSRMRYARSAHPQLWRAVHRSVYVAWPLAIAHGIGMHGVPVWAAWSYGICAALVALAVGARVRLQNPISRTLAAAPGERPAPLAADPGLPALPPAVPPPPAVARPATAPPPPAVPRPRSAPPWAPARRPGDPI